MTESSRFKPNNTRLVDKRFGPIILVRMKTTLYSSSLWIMAALAAPMMISCLAPGRGPAESGAPSDGPAAVDAQSSATSPAKTDASKADATSAATAPVEASNEAWMAAYPFQASTSAMNAEMAASPGGYGGSTIYERSTLMPELLTNFKGSAFALEYREDRGHAHAMQDLVLSKRVNAKSPGACITCKTASIATIFKEQGWSYASAPLSSLTGAGHPGISCSNCHDLETGHLAAKQPGFLEAIERKSVKRSLDGAYPEKSAVCAQCHAEYYFEPVTNRVIHPWDEGLDAGAMYAYYQKLPGGFEKDYVNSLSGTPMLKAQHPDFEEYLSGVHASAGVSCADCHMARVADSGTVKTSHFITSPLKNIAGTCGTCHGDKPEAWLASRVKDTQDRVYAAQRTAGQAIARTHEAVAARAAQGAGEASLRAARASLREAQWYWDYVASANSMGFHAPTAALGNLATAIELAYKARLALYE